MSTWSLDTVELHAFDVEVIEEPSSSTDFVQHDSESIDSFDGDDGDESHGVCDSTTSTALTRVLEWLDLPMPDGDGMMVEEDPPMGDEFPDQSHWVLEHEASSVGESDDGDDELEL